MNPLKKIIIEVVLYTILISTLAWTTYQSGPFLKYNFKTFSRRSFGSLSLDILKNHHYRRWDFILFYFSKDSFILMVKFF